jgi:hypothetical protein
MLSSIDLNRLISRRLINAGAMSSRTFWYRVTNTTAAGNVQNVQVHTKPYIPIVYMTGFQWK